MDYTISTSFYFLNLFGGEKNWMSKRKFVVLLSTTKVEYMTITRASKEFVWLERLCSGIVFVQQSIRIDFYS
jgi:hypothetical protein